MDLRIKGKKAIVCASSRGLGRACAEYLADAGVSIVINGINEERLLKVADEIREKHNAEVKAVAADVSTKEGRDKILSECDEPDILVNNNGGPPFRDFHELSKEDIMDGVNMNMITPIEMIKAVIDGMSERKFGRIVNITSLSVKMPIVGLDLSSGARAGLTAFMAGIARSVAHNNVTINHILPGLFDTDRMKTGLPAIAKLQNKTVEQVAKDRAAQIPARRFGKPDEFGALCAYLCSEQASFITGQSILLDGGTHNSSF